MQLVDVAQALTALGRRDEGEIILKRIVADPAHRGNREWPRAAAALAVFRLADQELDEAVTLAEQALAAAPRDPLLLGMYRQIGLALIDQGRRADAQTWIKKASELEPWDPKLKSLIDPAPPSD